MSVRGVASGVAGSAAAAVIAAVSLGMAHASTDIETRPVAHALVTPAPPVSPVRAALPRPAWLRHLLSRRDLPMEAPRRRG